MKLTREDKALQLFKAGAVSKISDDLYHVGSQKDPNLAYEVIPLIKVCTCVDFERTGQACKHVMATQIYRASQIFAVVTAVKIQALNQIGKVEAEA